jgi:hypothetical protein
MAAWALIITPTTVRAVRGADPTEEGFASVEVAAGATPAIPVRRDRDRLPLGSISLSIAISIAMHDSSV